MNIIMQTHDNEAGLSYSKWDLALIGSAVDDRGLSAIAFAERNAKQTVETYFNPESLEIKYNDKKGQQEDFEDFIKSVDCSTIMIDATTMRFAELFIACKSCKNIHNLNHSIYLTILYIEPDIYFKPKERKALDRRVFELSDQVEFFSGIPGSMLFLRDDIPVKSVFLLGFEGQRLDQAFEQLSLSASNTTIIFGVPAYRPGWEMDSFSNNIRVINERDIKGGIIFCGAQNPLSAFNALYSAYNSRDTSKEERMVISPIGTKPHAIGAALFACVNEQVGIIFDNPVLRQERTSEIGKWHLYNINFD